MEQKGCLMKRKKINLRNKRPLKSGFPCMHKTLSLSNKAAQQENNNNKIRKLVTLTCHTYLLNESISE